MHSDVRSGAFAPSFEGRFSDGGSPASGRVEVRLGPRGIEIVGAAGGSGTAHAQDVLVWPYGALATAEPLGVHAVDVLVSYAYQPDATLFVPSGGFARALAAAAPHLTVRAVRWRHARPWIIAALTVVGALGLAAMAEPSPARTIANLLPDRVRAQLGDQTVAAMTRGRKVCEAAAGRAALDKLTRRLSDAAAVERPFSVTVVDWGLVNAFATPGERIVLTRGLIGQADSPDEVAGVLAHEMGHGIELHPEASLVRAVGLSAAMELMLGGGGGTIGNIGLVMVQIGYTRNAEEEADGQAIRLLKEAGISPKGLASFFRKVLRLEQPRGKTGGLAVPDVLRTHPPSEARARHVELQPAYPSTASLDDDEWKALKAICVGAKPETKPESE